MNHARVHGAWRPLRDFHRIAVILPLLALLLASFPSTEVQAADFRLLLLPSSVELGQTGSVTVTVILLGEGQGPAQLSLNQLPAGVSANLQSTSLSIPGISILTLSSAPPFVPGSYTLEISASDGAQVKLAPLAIAERKSLEIKAGPKLVFGWPESLLESDVYLFDESFGGQLLLSLETTKTVSYSFSPPVAVAAETYRSKLSLVPLFDSPGLVDLTIVAGSSAGSARASLPLVLLFPDTRGSWAAESIAELIAQGILAGYPDGTFRPSNPLTRAEMAKILSLAFELPIVRPAGPTWSDLPADYWAHPYIERLWKANVLQGFPDGTLHPNDPVKRSEVAAMLARIFKWPSVPPNYAPTFTDLDNTHWAFLDVETGAWQGAWDGYPDGSYKPEALASRAEIAVLISRLAPMP